jgi:DNA-binding response OmpR family regulator
MPHSLNGERILVTRRPTPEPAMSALGRRPLVLIGEPNDDARGMLALLLDAAGYDTAECDGGEASIAHAQRLTPDVMLLSTTSWGDTLRVARTLRDGDSTRGTQVILLTGHGDPEYRRHAFEAGCKACLLKPVDINQLVTEISRLTSGDGASSSSLINRRHASADARQFVQDCCNSIESAKAALDHARTVSARAEKQVQRANRFLLRVGNRPVGSPR